MENKEIKDQRLSLRISNKDKIFIRKRSVDLGMTIAEYIVYLVKQDTKLWSNRSVTDK